MPPQSKSPLPLAVLISGGGRTLQNLLDRAADGRLDVDVRLVISSSPKAGGLALAQAAGVPTQVIERREFASDEAFGEANFAAIRQSGARVVVLGGYLKFVPIPDDYADRVLNIHPALIPAFCGKGYYGSRVHSAVLEYGAKVSGCTVHFVDNQFDHGPIVLQRTLDVAEDDTPESLAARVFKLECEALPEALQAVAEGRVEVVGRRVHVRA